MMDTPQTKQFKSLDLSGLDLDEFQPKAPKISKQISDTGPIEKPQKRQLPPKTTFPSREPIQPKYQQLNMHIRSDVADRFRELAVRDQYTTWKYGQIIEFLLDHYEKTR